jgi:hypothetical protein
MKIKTDYTLYFGGIENKEVQPAIRKPGTISIDPVFGDPSAGGLTSVFLKPFAHRVQEVHIGFCLPQPVDQQFHGIDFR